MIWRPDSCACEVKMTPGPDFFTGAVVHSIRPCPTHAGLPSDAERFDRLVAENQSANFALGEIAAELGLEKSELRKRWGPGNGEVVIERVDGAPLPPSASAAVGRALGRVRNGKPVPVRAE